MKAELNHGPGLQRSGSETSRSVGAGFSDLNKQVLRVLRCSAHALAHSPGGLRFKAGTRPWLEGLQPSGRSVLISGTGRHNETSLLTHADSE